MRYLKSVLLAVGLTVLAGAANAAIVEARFGQELTNRFTDYSSKLVASPLRGVGDGPELTAADVESNPGNFPHLLEVDLDPIAKTWTLTPTGRGAYSAITTFLVDIHFSLQEEITSVSLISNTAIDENDFDLFVYFTATSMTANIVNLNDDVFWFIPGGSMVFAYNTETSSTDVPAPASLALLATGLFGLAGLRRRFA